MAQEVSVRNIGLDDPITSVALMVAAIRGEATLPLGTAAFIAPELAVTAKHVVEQFFTSFEAPIPTSPTPVPFDVLAFQFLGSASAMAVWRARRIWTTAWTDLALVHLAPWNDLAKGYSWATKIALSAAPPAIGDRIAAFGYPASDLRLHLAPTESRLEWSLAPTTVTGVVEEVHEEKRDSFLRHYPCFRTSATFLGGMSGGPVFAQEGKRKGMLCGIICSEIELPPGETTALSYATTLWPLLGLTVDFEAPGCVVKGPYPLFELPTLHHRFFDEFRNRAIVEEGENGPSIRFHPSPVVGGPDEPP